MDDLKTKPPREGLDLNKSDGAAVVTNATGWHLDVSPGDATRYRMAVVQRPGGGLYVVLWGGEVVLRTTEDVGGYVEHITGRYSEYTTQMVGALLDEHVRKKN